VGDSNRFFQCKKRVRISKWGDLQTYRGDTRISIFELKLYTIRLIWSYQLLESFFYNKSWIFLGQYSKSHRKLTAACQTKAKRKNSTGITGIKSTIGFKKSVGFRQFGEEKTIWRKSRIKPDTDQTKDIKHNKRFVFLFCSWR